MPEAKLLLLLLMQVVVTMEMVRKATDGSRPSVSEKERYALSSKTLGVALHSSDCSVWPQEAAADFVRAVRRSPAADRGARHAPDDVVIGGE